MTSKTIFSSPQEQKETFDKCREYAKTQGFDGLIIAPCIWDYNEINKEIYWDSNERGYDFHCAYNSGYSPEKSFPTDDEIIEGQCRMLEKRLSVDPMHHTPTVSCFRDATPRTTKAWCDLGFKYDKETIYRLSAEGFRKTIRRMKQITDALPEGAWGKRIFMIDNWNEWDEGHYIAPSHEYGFRYLQAIREELTERDNLPDYRTPQDLGFTNLNKTWNTPDMSAVCEKRLKEKI